MYRRLKDYYISTKPSLLTLWYSAISEILIMITLNWWFIKRCILYSIWNAQFCKANFMDESLCDNNKYCQYVKDECRHSRHTDYALFITYCIIWSFWIFIQGYWFYLADGNDDNLLEISDIYIVYVYWFGDISYHECHLRKFWKKNLKSCRSLRKLDLRRIGNRRRCGSGQTRLLCEETETTTAMRLRSIPKNLADSSQG